MRLTRRVPRLHARVIVVGLLMMLAPRACAHMVQTGFGPLFDGLFHMLIGPDAVMLAAAAGLLSAMRGDGAQPGYRVGRWLFLYGWAVFCGAAAWCQYPFDFPITAALTLAALGVLAASDLAVPPVPMYIIYGWAGGVYGLNAGGSMEGMDPKLILFMYVVDLALLALVFAGARALLLRFPKARIAARVAGSWITAIAMLQFGWTLKMRSLQ